MTERSEAMKFFDTVADLQPDQCVDGAERAQCAALWHATSLWYFLIVGLGLWFVDRLIRHTRSCALAGGVVISAQGQSGSDCAVTTLEIETLDGSAPLFEAGHQDTID